MMRLTMAIWWSLALVWFVTSYAGAEPAVVPIARRFEIKGYGSTAEAARKDALHEATAKLRVELLQVRIEHWQPSDAVVQRDLLDGAGHPDEDVQVEPLGPQKTWVVRLQIPSIEILRNLDRQAQRYETAEMRMGSAIRVVAALAVLLAVIVGGIYVDEWTQSRYTAWLRVAGAGLVTAAAVGWWWLR